MRTLAVVELEAVLQALFQLGHPGILVQVDVFVLDGAPERIGLSPAHIGSLARFSVSLANALSRTRTAGEPQAVSRFSTK